MSSDEALSQKREALSRVYDILVEHCGADPRDTERQSFLYHQLQEPKCVEYRFIGNLGFGGKFWRNGHMYVTCYRESETADRVATIKKVNEMLGNLPGRELISV